MDNNKLFDALKECENLQKDCDSIFIYLFHFQKRLNENIKKMEEILNPNK